MPHAYTCLARRHRASWRRTPGAPIPPPTRQAAGTPAPSAIEPMSEAPTRRRAGEDHHVDAHDAPAELVRHRDLDDRVAAVLEDDLHGADQEQDDRRQREVPHERQAEDAERHAHARNDHGGERGPSAAQHRESDRADDGSRAERRHEQAEHVHALVQHLAREEGDEDAVVHGEGADREHEAQDEGDERCARRVADAVEELLADRRAAARPGLRARPDDGEGQQDGQEGQRVQQERDRGAVARDEEAAQRGADDAGGVERGRVERDAVQEVLPADHLDEEGLPGRHVERVHQADHARERGHVPVAHPAGPREARRGRRRAASGPSGWRG